MTTAAKHTAGPWKFTGLSKPSNFADHVAIVQGDGVVLARIRGGVTDDKAIAAANARMIAAAPELLEFAKWVAGRGGDNNCMDIFKRARSLIAKAEGGAS